MKRFILALMLVMFLLPILAGAHGIHDKFYDKYPYAVERWRPFIVKMLKEHHIYTTQKVWYYIVS